MATPTHLYPGVNIGLREMPEVEFKLKDEKLVYPIGFPNYRMSESVVMPVKEVAMMILMDTLTDKPDWHKKVFDDAIVQKWRDEARQRSEDGLYARVAQDKLEEGPPKPQSRIITDAAFDYCIQELQGKARYFEQTGLIPTLDGPRNTIIKSDSYIDDALHRDLNRACYMLWKDHESNIDWHPRNRSPFIQEEAVGVSNALELMGKGEPVKGETPIDRNPVIWLPRGYRSSKVLPDYWSDKYQWLPANIGFRDDGSAKFTSYVNNLHPSKFPDIYKTIERLIDRAIPAWDHCLREVSSYKDKSFVGRAKSRFKWIHEASDDDDELWTPEFDIDVFLHKDIQLTHQELRDLEEDCYHDAEEPIERDEDEDRRREDEGLPPLTPNVDDESLAIAKWEKFRDAILPDPEPFEPVDYAPKQSLREKFKEHGL
ncbi:hypothetical protein IL306_011005 [Fusarium sp. DS 682]|nr:hypothetical protein IL306_011005 [Fusarium sp. DS 682]